MKVDTIENKGRPAEIFLVEDNYGDVILAKKAFTEGRLANHITVANDGVQALAMLRREAGYESTPSPDIILLDLNLPKKSGKEVLAEIKEDDKLKHIPVVILTSSRAELDVVKSYNLHANSYIIKPVSLDQFSEVVKTIEQFWFTIVVLPDDAR
jgi:CheY-like chemotaxis protein